MATKLLHLLALLSLLLVLLHSHMAMSQSSLPSSSFEDEEDEEEYVLDSPFSHTHLRSRFLTSIKKGKRCHPEKNNVCNGVPANKGKSLLYCCKEHCRNVLGDKNNCGQCGHKCKVFHKCCSGICVNLRVDPHHCGKCGVRCGQGESCEYGYCGYA